MRRGAWILLAATILALPGAARGSEDAGVRSVFATGAGNRALALGGAFTAVSDDASGLLWNPGGLGFIPRRQVQLTRTSLYGLGIDEEFAGAVLPDWRFGTGALALRHLGVGGIDQRDSRNDVLGTDLSDNQMEIALAYGRRIGDEVGVGGSLKLDTQSLAGYTGSAIRADVGALAYPGLFFAPTEDWSHRLAVGLAVRNLVDTGLRLDLDKVADPTTARAGVSYLFPLGGDRRLLAALDLEDSPNLDAVVHAGVEVWVHPVLALRTGMNGGTFTAGTGIRWQDFSFDYAFEENTIGSVHRLGLSWTFGTTVDEARQASLKAEEDALAARLEEAFARREKERIRSLLAEAQTDRAQGDLDGALDALAVAAALNPADTGVAGATVACLFDKGTALEKSGSFAEAAVIYARIHTLDPADPTAEAKAAHAREESDRRALRSQEIQDLFAGALDALSAGNLADARSGFQRILAVEPQDTEARSLLDRTEETMVKQSDETLADADRLIRAGQFPEAAAAISRARRLGMDPARADRLEAALAAAKKAASIQTAGAAPAPPAEPLTGQKLREVEDLYKRGMDAMEAGRSEDAVRYWELVASADPDFQQVRDHLKREYLMRGMDAFAAGRLDEAIMAWEKAVRLDPEDSKAKGYLARAREQQNRSREILGGTGQ